VEECLDLFFKEVLPKYGFIWRAAWIHTAKPCSEAWIDSLVELLPFIISNNLNIPTKTVDCVCNKHYMLISWPSRSNRPSGRYGVFMAVINLRLLFYVL
jgi:hypothetical protein